MTTAEAEEFKINACKNYGVQQKIDVPRLTIAGALQQITPFPNYTCVSP